MFRDESSKVIQKAHAQWGISTPSASSSAATPTTGRLSPQDSTDGSTASSSASYSSVSPSDLTMFTYNLTSESPTALPDDDPSHPAGLQARRTRQPLCLSRLRYLRTLTKRASSFTLANMSSVTQGNRAPLPNSATLAGHCTLACRTSWPPLALAP